MGASFAAALAVSMLAGPALADGMGRRGSLKDPPKPAERCKHSANIALRPSTCSAASRRRPRAPRYRAAMISRAASSMRACGPRASISPATCPAPVSTSAGAPYDASIEMDWYIGIKPVTGKITWDLGVIYYSYPNKSNPGLDLNYWN